MKAVHFGAGNIGRGFIGLLLSRSGYEVCFIDVNDTLVSQLQQRGEYTVTLANEAHDSAVVSGVTAINGKDLDQVAEAVANADLVTTAVGVTILKHIAGGIAKGIEQRLSRSSAPLHVIACENAIGGSSQLKEHVYSQLSEEIRGKVDQYVAFPDAAVDRIVPIQHHEDPLKVTVEPFYEWVVDRSRMIEGFNEVKGIHYVDELTPYIERKLFTVNTGHSTAAYLGYLHGFSTIQESMADVGITSRVQQVMEETGEMLVKKYGFDPEEHMGYIHKILDRFRNPYLTDEVERVGRSPIRKLSPNDRLVRPALQAFELGIQPNHLALAMAAALLFDNAEDPEAVELQSAIQALGINQAVTQYTSIPEEHPVHALILNHVHQLKQKAHS
ncbi:MULTISPECIES: mannitol-1-phosphate 5-dehydrogenase [unclassified Paenibacillus]|uniref:mannitol-1-phosphate 5-dehydrogenase n=1 Tax=unclassified Paenibacillus TaxID=185978 RepID=UPI001AE25DC3|nr:MULTISPECIES: mannitol-1-phosphate 5-dehydrogenase [unclassified Paenibacillus]MBP1157414.1 mannitol-1-phosphate 5-dehydrogenase [Paenibacillus sp. PvP091]MBP1171848.1 mannitol-1-phosphate 5-dehydrogenase [Paenibacillus sp. PvR098]MBP2438229.1 mannitol-1-phosphate 5-dehydrogenase [Paenibacillus sp. PvP052]